MPVYMYMCSPVWMSAHMWADMWVPRWMPRVGVVCLPWSFSLHLSFLPLPPKHWPAGGQVALVPAGISHRSRKSELQFSYLIDKCFIRWSISPIVPFCDCCCFALLYVEFYCVTQAASEFMKQILPRQFPECWDYTHELLDPAWFPLLFHKAESLSLEKFSVKISWTFCLPKLTQFK